MKSLKRTDSGFTIIEVVLVLAIAGLIFLIVFLALPQLQSSRRDTQRKNDAGRLLAAIENFAGNHSGVYPGTIDATWAGDNVSGVFQDPNGTAYAFGGTPGGLGEGEFAYGNGQTCTPGAESFTAGNPRDVAVAVGLENGEYCQDNQ